MSEAKRRKTWAVIKPDGSYSLIFPTKAEAKDCLCREDRERGWRVAQVEIREVTDSTEGSR